jgi:hypothetical protein
MGVMCLLYLAELPHRNIENLEVVLLSVKHIIQL